MVFADRRLDSLDPAFLPKAMELIARAAEAGVALMIVNTRRSQTEQAQAIAEGVSWTAKSRHLVGLAIDVAPYEQYALHGPDKLTWDEKDPAWQKVGAIGQALGLKWGVVVNGVRKDLGHFEMPVALVAPTIEV